MKNWSGDPLCGRVIQGGRRCPLCLETKTAFLSPTGGEGGSLQLGLNRAPAKKCRISGDSGGFQVNLRDLDVDFCPVDIDSCVLIPDLCRLRVSSSTPVYNSCQSHVDFCQLDLDLRDPHLDLCPLVIDSRTPRFDLRPLDVSSRDFDPGFCDPGLDLCGLFVNYCGHESDSRIPDFDCDDVKRNQCRSNYNSRGGRVKRFFDKSSFSGAHLRQEALRKNDSIQKQEARKC